MERPQAKSPEPSYTWRKRNGERPGPLLISDQQQPEEWLWFLDQIGAVNRYLEIGSFNGNSLLALASSGALQQGATIRAIDLADKGTGERLKQVCVALTEMGYDAKCHIGNSRSAGALQFAQEAAPYDVVFIDGDHSYDGLASDWRLYGPLGKKVAFHDIGGACMAFWGDLKEVVHMELYIAPEELQLKASGPQGIGIVFQ